jgi:sulfatase maturation enzyme AslB (radical SAM superfamily)
MRETIPLMAETMFLRPAKFTDPLVTVTGAPRASVPLTQLETLWFNTGTLCNIACDHCFMESSPRNDSLAYLGRDEARDFMTEAKASFPATREIGFTGGEPFMNPDIIPMLDDAELRTPHVI